VIAITRTRGDLNDYPANASAESYIFPPRHEPTEDAMSKGKEKRKPKADKSKKKGAAPAQAGSVTNAFAKKPQKP
jgi:hypothetical protein